ncbi:hypothetical protein GCM10012285_44890 [Streptomyces kronopolitis]|uniref:Uncharacterized protein n=1 Tax=Streptomyces kronopolitis TaxID=1612435 RepID=A0ABQ2JRT3_9ACTN|nr:hypothetical protein GCM10012285_44890 [Streptomyces kronopolitis]
MNRKLKPQISESTAKRTGQPRARRAGFAAGTDPALRGTAVGVGAGVGVGVGCRSAVVPADPGWAVEGVAEAVGAPGVVLMVSTIGGATS